jgi:hypothetical protein
VISGTAIAPGIQKKSGAAPILEHNSAFTNKTHIAREILSYLAEHPDAQDTLEGIVEWWLLERKIINQTTTVKAVINILISEGWVIDSIGRDSRVHYRINSDKYNEMMEEIAGRRDSKAETGNQNI